MVHGRKGDSFGISKEFKRIGVVKSKRVRCR